MTTIESLQSSLNKRGIRAELAGCWLKVWEPSGTYHCWKPGDEDGALCFLFLDLIERDGWDGIEILNGKPEFKYNFMAHRPSSVDEIYGVGLTRTDAVVDALKYADEYHPDYALLALDNQESA